MTSQRHPAADANVEPLRDKFVDSNDTWIENLSVVVELAGSLWDNSSADFRDRNKKALTWQNISDDLDMSSKFS